MIIYSFASIAPNRLFAFAGDGDSASLPAQHGPWKSIGEIRPDETIPNGLDRERIERAIEEYGYQMWRMKKPEQATPKRPRRGQRNSGRRDG